MAEIVERKKSKWSLVKGILAVLMPEGNSGSWDLTKLFPLFLEMTETQQEVIAYGVKQKLADSCARNSDTKLTEAESIAQMEKTWEMLLSGKFTSGTRGTGISVAAKVEKAVAAQGIEKYKTANKAQRKMLLELGIVQAEWVKDIA